MYCLLDYLYRLHSKIELMKLLLTDLNNQNVEHLYVNVLI